MKFDTHKRITAWLCFGIAFIVYALTAQQSVMFWDSGEFIASSAKLQATHPPGAPLYTLLSRLFLALFPVGLMAYAASLFSALCGAFTVFFLFHTLLWLGQKLLKSLNYAKEEGVPIVLGVGVVGSLTLTFSDSFWVSSTEAEVYTLSTLFMALAFWAGTKWGESFQNKANAKWLVLICYLLGLSIGEHILNLAVLFPVVMLIAIKQYGFKLRTMCFG